jgi:hypothetical protein
MIAIKLASTVISSRIDNYFHDFGHAVFLQARPFSAQFDLARPWVCESEKVRL